MLFGVINYTFLGYFCIKGGGATLGANEVNSYWLIIPKWSRHHPRYSPTKYGGYG